jgi:hypothetical protein
MPAIPRFFKELLYMRKLTTACALALAAAVLPALALAQVESTPIPAPHKPDFSAMAFQLGTWTCRTKSARRPAAYVTTVVTTVDPSGYWLNQVSSTARTSWVAIPLRTWDKITYDSDTHRWVDVSYGDGGAYGLSFSKGWDGNQITWHDVSFAADPDIGSQTDIVTTKISAMKTIGHSSFTETKTGRRVSVVTTCTKS